MKAFLNEDDKWIAQDGEECRFIPTNGLLWHPVRHTAFTFNTDAQSATETTWTFEDAVWYGLASPLNWIMGRLNPFSFATQETSDKVFKLCQEAVANNFNLVLSKVSSHAVGPFRRTDERSILVESKDGERSEKFSAGVLGANCARRGNNLAMLSWVTELKVAFS